jgi:sialate O-acetylesterase
MKNRGTITFLLLFMLHNCFPNVSLPAIFSDNMVLQRNSEVKIWGWAKPGEEVKIELSWSDIKLSSKADKNAYWEQTIKTSDLRGSQEIKITGYNEIVLRNVLLGEVWLVSGQSNMEWSAAAGLDNAAEAIAGAENPEIRFFQVAHRTANSKQQDLDGSWVSSTPETMKNFSAVAYFFGKKLNKELGVPIGLINSSWGGTPAEVWMPAEIIENSSELSKAASLLPSVEWGPRSSGSLYNAMIAPLIPFKIAGILWYQGESNTDNAKHYDVIFSTLIQSWRKNWEEEFPFLFAQIAPFNYGEGDAGVKIRDAQRRVLDLPKTGMVMTSDIGNINDIHPRNKLDVGLRFANIALADVYGKDLKAHPPLFDRIEGVNGKNLKVHFKNSEGLKFDKNDPASQFEIAGEDKIFYPAKAEIKNGIVHLNSVKVKEPVHVRFSWGNTATSNLYNSANLPASSFTSEY